MPGSSPGKKEEEEHQNMLQILILSQSKDEGFNTARAAHPSTGSG